MFEFSKHLERLAALFSYISQQECKAEVLKQLLSENEEFSLSQVFLFLAGESTYLEVAHLKKFVQGHAKVPDVQIQSLYEYFNADMANKVTYTTFG